MCSIKRLACPHSLIQGNREQEHPVLWPLWVFLDCSLVSGGRTRVASVKRKEPTGQVCMMPSPWLCRCEGRGTNHSPKINITYSLPSLSLREKKIRRRITTPSQSPACTSFWECNYALLYLRAIQTIIIPMTLKDSSEVEWHLLPLKTFGQRPEFWGTLT